ncbi:hypothetical protein WA026_002203 [Henosepilachna vigintioctopunctata]|uniref:Uncharacterized protein n=1 Tax=Henosepilachna vigintioctopunctata TaxID=420089 RepID=A0AAW1U053_9CUCU
MGLLILLSSGVYWDIRVATTAKKWYLISWLFPQIRDVIEFKMLEIILLKYKRIILAVNKHYKALNRFTNFNTIFPSTKPQKLDYLTNRETFDKVASIRESSFINLEIVNAATDLAKVFTWPLVVTLCTKLWNIINCTYYIASSLTLSRSRSPDMEIWRPAMWNVFCIVYTVSLIKLWNAVEIEVSI